jgi:hypothetical protein
MTMIATSPSAAAQVHVPLFRPTDAERAAAMARGARLGIGASLVAGFLALPFFELVRFEIAEQLVPLTWLIGIVAACTLAMINVRSPAARANMHTASWTLLFAGVGLATPLSVHFAVAGLLGLHNFDEWVRMSISYVGLAHVVFAGMLALRGFRFARGRRAPAPHMLAIWGGAIVATFARMTLEVPAYGPLAFLPVAYVAATAVPILVAVKIAEVIARRSEISRGSEPPPHARIR